MKSSNGEPMVKTTAGWLRGGQEAGLAVFRGVPYAAAPVGERRWRATEPHPGWSGVRDAVTDGPIPPQPVGLPHDAVLGTRGRASQLMDEDCLTLTLWSPGIDDARRPVLVWIHGGGMTTGAGSWEVYSCEQFARNGDLVAVSINYRLGPSGFLYAEDGGGGCGNFWMDDILAALRWVQDNIAAFGGDPTNVTVAGQSGGALSIAYLMGGEVSSGLFRRAILQSMPPGFSARSSEKAREVTDHYFAVLGVSTLQEARHLSMDRLLTASETLAQETNGWGLFIPSFVPVLDGRLIEQQILSSVAQGRGANIDLLLGWNREEDTFFHVPDPVTRSATVKQVVERARLPFGDAASQVYMEYAQARPGALPVEILSDITTDERYCMSSLRLADLRATQDRPAYVYQLDWQTQAFDGLLGAPHCLELPFVFHNFDAWSDAPMLKGTDSPGDRRWRTRCTRPGSPSYAQAIPTTMTYLPGNRITVSVAMPCASTPSSNPLMTCAAIGDGYGIVLGEERNNRSGWTIWCPAKNESDIHVYADFGTKEICNEPDSWPSSPDRLCEWRTGRH